LSSDPRPETDRRGSLTVVGTGIQALGHLTFEARANITHADAVLYLVNEPVTERYIQELNPAAQSLHPLYASGKERIASYLEMVEQILAGVRRGLRVCAVFYGHPGVFVFPSHEAIRQARSEGYAAEMLPAVSAEDCLFADLGIDPALAGCQSFEATDFLVFGRRFDPTCSLVLWQIGVIGHLTFEHGGYDYRPGLEVLVRHLLETYPPDHLVVVYEAAHLPTAQTRHDAVPLGQLASADVTPVSTLYVPPREPAEADEEMLARLGLAKDSLPRVKHQISIAQTTGCDSAERRRR
jgi:uncharacterized protein YabN with tetrapyrrole methylase and pyrophosphatase domain